MDSTKSAISKVTTEERDKPSKTLKKSKASSKKDRELTRSTSESTLSEEEDLNDSILSEEGLNDSIDSDIEDNSIRKPRSRLRGTSVDRSVVSSASSGVSFLGSIDYDSDGSDDTIHTNDDDDMLSRSIQSTGSRVTYYESDGEIQQEFFRYMETQAGRVSGVKAFTVYKEYVTSHNGKAEASRDYVFAALVASDAR